MVVAAIITTSSGATSGRGGVNSAQNRKLITERFCGEPAQARLGKSCLNH